MTKNNFARFHVSDIVKEHQFKQLLQDIEQSETPYKNFQLQHEYGD